MSRIILIIALINISINSSAREHNFIIIDSVISDKLPISVIIIPSIHKGNKLVNEDTLFRILKSINPDLILNEIEFNHKEPISFKIVRFFHLGEFTVEYKLFKKWNEYQALKPWKAYDIDVKNRRKFSKRVLRFEDKLRNYLNKFYNKEKTTLEDKAKIVKYIKPKNYVLNHYSDSELYEISQPAVDDSVRKFILLRKIDILPLIKSNPYFKNIRKEAIYQSEFWDYRNIIMAKNIISFIDKTKSGKTIIVIGGALHKYYLEDLLKPQQEKYNFKLYDYWQLFKD